MFHIHRLLLAIAVGTASLIALLPVEAAIGSAPLVPITPANADRVVEIERLGRGQSFDTAWSPNGKTLAVGTDTAIWLYDAQHLDAEPRHIPDQLNENRQFSAFFFSADDAYLVTREQNAITVWDAVSGANLVQLPAQPTDQSADHVDPYPILTDPIQVTIGGKPFDLSIDARYFRPATNYEPQQLIFSEEAHFKEGTLHFSPDEKYLLFAPTSSTSAELWDVQAARQVASLDQGYFMWSPDSRHLLSIRNSYIDTVYRIPDGQALWTNNQAQSKCSGETWSPDGKSIAMWCGGSLNREIVVIGAQDGHTIGTPFSPVDLANTFVFSPDSTLLLFSGCDPDGSQGMIAWNYSTEQSELVAPASELLAPVSELVTPAFDGNYNVPITWGLQPNGVLLAVMTTDHMIKLYDVSDRKLKKQLQFHLDLGHLQFTPDSQQLVVSENNAQKGNDLIGTLWTWDVASGQLVTFHSKVGSMDSLDISADGKYVLIGSEYVNAVLWNIQDGTVVTGDYLPWPLLFSPIPGAAACRGPADGNPTGYNAHCWDLPKTSSRPRLSTPTGLVPREMAFSNDSKLLVNSDGLFDTRTMKLIGTPKDSFYVAVFSPDDKLLATCAWSTGTLELWTVPSLTLKAALPSACTQVAFSPDGRTIAATDGPNLILFDVARETIVAARKSLSDIYSLAFSPDGTRLATGLRIGLIQIWGVPGR